MAAIVALNNANIMVTMINIPDGTLLLVLLGEATGTTVIPAYNIYMDEDWSLARDIIYWFKKNYSIVVREQQQMIFGTLTQESDLLELKRLGLNRPLNDDLIETLKQIKIEKNDILLGEDIYNQPATKTKPKTPFHQSITTEDVNRIENITKANLQAVAKSLQETIF
ncbi:10871_t:CDS:2 [Dentiscutata heterogama]|uniref:10871_t:CDS:1 n=1 Tax=Dentiscutata heterogama TaxID=1316150 RepID=A0ACA9KYG4_9GLOM|nr:10871_t:CDS:2 [Dentiscutata heterogama]